MNKSENAGKFSETVDNTLPEGNDYDVFSENTAKTLAEAENMNRDYLSHIYNEDMSFLNKEVRMTRMQYLRETEELNTYFEAEKKRYKKYFVLIIVVLIILLGVGIWALHEWYVCWKFYQAATADAYIGQGVFGRELRSIWAMTSLYGGIGWISVVVGLAQFGFFGFGYYKKLKELERYRNKALDSIETRKKEAMLLGQYDSVK